MLITEVKEVLDSIKASGWKDLFEQHGLDIEATDLQSELLRPLPSIDRTAPGFEDFSSDATRGIEPGRPSHSLLYHAFASAGVQRLSNGTPLGSFPTMAQIETIENFVFGINPKSLNEISNQFGGSNLVVAVFACDYRSANETNHGFHADLMFSRTGVARTGTEEPLYDARLRGYVPFPNNVKGVRVLPARYAAWLAVARTGSASNAIPMRIQSGDTSRQFLIPVYKLFAGNECIKNMDLDLDYSIAHVSEKLKRTHLELSRLHNVSDTGAAASDLDSPPFKIVDGLADLSSDNSDPACLVVPTVHQQLVEPATFQGKPAKFFVPPNNNFSSSLGLSEFSDRQGPEFVHVRTEVKDDDSTVDLNDTDDVASKVRTGNYFAQHYLDHTADGWVKADCPQLAGEVDDFVPAYSFVSAPDFYPLVNQRQLTEWTESVVAMGLSRDEIWAFAPDPLCDDRLAANQDLPDSPFTPNDTTVAAVVSMGHPLAGGPAGNPPVADPLRRTHLPDDAAGIFAPGWDVSTVTTNGVNQFASYGLGSPFPEDAKLCAALSAFWPAVAPDIARSVQPIGGLRRTVVPLVDEEIGIGQNAVPWDGLEPLKDLGNELEYPSMQHADYVGQSLAGDLTLSLTGRLSFQGYTERIIATTLLYRTLEKLDGHGPNKSLLYSIREVESSDSELIAAQAGLAFLLPSVFAVKVSSIEGQNFTPPSAKRVRIDKHKTASLFVSANSSSPFVLFREDTGPDAGQWKLDTPLA